MRRSLRVSCLLMVASSVGAQNAPTRCYFDNATPDTHQDVFHLPSGQYNTFIGRGVIIRCPAKKLTLRSDSLESYGDEKRVFLLGNVHYNEPRFVLTSDFLTYFLTDERIVATGNVHGLLPTGSQMQGPVMQYFRAAPKIRPRAQLLATGRPTASIVQMDARGQRDLPILVTGNTIFMDGDSLIYGSGGVEIQRTEISAHADSAFLDGTKEVMHLMRAPKVEGKRGDRPFTMVGDLIDAYSANRKIHRILSRAKAVATSKDLTLRADTIDLRVTNDLLDRAIAWGTSRARATSPTQDLLADSIDVRMPGQRVREMRAFRKAFAQAKADTVKFRADTTDWLHGDTIIAQFDTVATPDTSKAPPIRQLRALGNASAYYHFPAEDTTLHKPAISYSKGKRITINFEKQQVGTVDVTENAVGILAQPTADTTRAGGSPRAAPALPAIRPTGRRPPGANGGPPS